MRAASPKTLGLYKPGPKARLTLCDFTSDYLRCDANRILSDIACNRSLRQDLRFMSHTLPILAFHACVLHKRSIDRDIDHVNAIRLSLLSADRRKQSGNKVPETCIF